MSKKLLTIGVPTYNRASNLRVLLTVLQAELVALEDLVDVIVSDNSSMDETSAVIASFSTSLLSLRSLRSNANLGADANISQCVLESRSKYVWIIGDDDVPKKGVIRQILTLLEREVPDLIYLRSEWVKKIHGNSQGKQVEQLTYASLGKLAFAAGINTWFTFISGIIFNKDTLLSTAGEAAIRRYVGTNFVQLGWVLNVLKSGSRFVFVRDRCVLATSNNTGGYAVISTFCSNYSFVVSDVLGRANLLTTTLVRRHLTCYLPALIWQVRFSNIGKFHAENFWPAVRRELGGYVYFWLVLAPICFFQKPFAWPFFQFARVIAAIIKVVDRAREISSDRMTIRTVELGGVPK